MNISLSRLLALSFLLSLLGCDGMQNTVKREPARLIVTWEEPIDPRTSLEQQLLFGHEFDEKLRSVGDYTTNSTISISEGGSKRIFTVEFILFSDDKDAEILKTMKQIFVGRSFSVKIISKKVSYQIGL